MGRKILDSRMRWRHTDYGKRGDRIHFKRSTWCLVLGCYIAKVLYIDEVLTDQKGLTVQWVVLKVVSSGFTSNPLGITLYNAWFEKQLQFVFTTNIQHLRNLSDAKLFYHFQFIHHYYTRLITCYYFIEHSIHISLLPMWKPLLTGSFTTKEINGKYTFR